MIRVTHRSRGRAHGAAPFHPAPHPGAEANRRSEPEVSMRKLSILLLALGLAPSGVQAKPAANCSGGWFYNTDVAQLGVTYYLTNFEAVFSGNLTTQILNGGTGAFTNAFPPTRQRSQTYNAGTDQTTVKWSTTGAGLAPSAGTLRHFGVGGDAGCDVPPLLIQYWTPTGSGPGGRAPAAGSKMLYPGGPGTASAEVMNNSPDEVTITGLGYRLVDRMTVTGDQLNSTGMPEGTFTFFAGTPFVLSSGGTSGPYAIPGVNPNLHAIVLYVRLHYSGASSNNGYGTQDAFEWMVTNMASAPTPVHPSTWGRLKVLYR